MISGTLICVGFGVSTSSGGSSGFTLNDAASSRCLACHGGSYDALADKTRHLGSDWWWNPHRSAHGTNVPCRTCHENIEAAQQNTRCTDKTVKISNACAKYCHTGGYKAPFDSPDPYPEERAQ